MDLLLVAAKTVSLAFGGVFTFQSVRAYCRRGSPALRALALGIGLSTPGTFFGGFLHQVVAVDFDGASRSRRSSPPPASRS